MSGAATAAPPSVVLLAIDHFELVNDTAGHLAGDDVLRRTAAALTGVLRGSDRAYRVGATSSP